MQILMLSPDAQMIDRRILQEAHTLIAAGYEVILLSGFECQEPDAYEERGLQVKRYRYDWEDRRKTRVVKRWGPLMARMVWPAVRIANRMSNGPDAFETFMLEKALEHEFDVVHVHDFPLLHTGVMAAKIRGVPIIYDSHEFYPVQSTLAPDVQKRYLALERRLVRDCAQIITVNPYIARLMADAHHIKPPAVILNACDTTTKPGHFDSGARRVERAPHGLPPDDFIFVYQGWLSPERNLEPMIEAMALQRPGVSLLIVGYGDYVDQLKDLATRHDVNQRIIFYGRVESDSLPALTRLCDVGIIPYRAVDEMHRYCSPNKLFEFIAAQIPILSSDLPYLRDVIDGYQIGWLGDLETAESCARLMCQIAGGSTLGEAARHNLAKAAASLNWEIEGRKLLDIYSKIAPLRQCQRSAA